MHGQPRDQRLGEESAGKGDGADEQRDRDHLRVNRPEHAEHRDLHDADDDRLGYVGDVVGALIKLMDHTEAVGQVFNIGSNQEITILELANRVKELTQSDSDIVFVPYDEAYEEGFEDMPRRVPDISKVSELVGFRPEMSLDGILKSVIDYQTGRIAWEHPQVGPGRTWGGVLSTDGGLVFFGSDDGSLSAADAATGRILWRFPANVVWKASPMTYMIDGRQFVAIQAGPTVLAFGL